MIGALLLAAASCVAGAPEPGYMGLRPTPAYRCALDGAAAAERLSVLLAARRPEAAAAEHLFDLPTQPVLFDDPRGLSYAVNLSGTGGWSLRIGGDETFCPRTGTPEFAGSLFPQRLHRGRRGDVQFDVLVSTPLTLASGRCFDAAELERRLLQAGWKESWTPPAADSGIITPTYTRGHHLGARIEASGTHELAGVCTWRLILRRDA